MSDYITSAELKATLEMTGLTYADADISVAITAASRGVEEATGRRFWLDDDALQVRYYQSERDGVLDIDDLAELTSVAVDRDGDGTFEEAWVLDTDFVLEPFNAAADAEPWTRISRHASADFGHFTQAYPRTVKVTGKFGWPAVPAAVKAATTIVATRLLRRTREAPFGIVSLGLDGTAIRAASLVNDPDIGFLLAPYSRQTILV